MLTEKENMISAMYDPEDPELVREWKKVRQLVITYNHSRPDEKKKQTRTLHQLLGTYP
ncbi:maltose acetyltransferase domain-containing protein [Salibacterium lacus]|uniref:Maltose acetyltransferase domain-containing protein n=1 Tax=Salibacterium lacus TaxID=1898109 RepID=A0ABW5T5D0_9BACI